MREYPKYDSQEWKMRVSKKSDKKVFDLTGYTAEAKIKKEGMDDIDLICDIPFPEDGIVMVTLTAVQAATLSGEYYFELRIKKAPNFNKRGLKEIFSFVD